MSTHIGIMKRSGIMLCVCTHSSNNRNAFHYTDLSIQTSAIPHVASIRVDYLNKVIDESNLSNEEKINNVTEFGWVNKKYFPEFQ